MINLKKSDAERKMDENKRITDILDYGGSNQISLRDKSNDHTLKNRSYSVKYQGDRPEIVA